jgi:hypothetical protein
MIWNVRQDIIAQPCCTVFIDRIDLRDQPIMQKRPNNPRVQPVSTPRELALGRTDCPARGLLEAGVEFTPKTYGDSIQSHDLHPERKFAGPDGQPCRSTTVGLLGNLAIVAAPIKQVGKEGNELDEHDAGVIDESERQLEYHDSEFDDLVRALREIPTKVIAEATVYNDRTLRRLKRGEFRPKIAHCRSLTQLVTQHRLEQVIDSPS